MQLDGRYFAVKLRRDEMSGECSIDETDEKCI
jgi:hypothetical protein